MLECSYDLLGLSRQIVATVAAAVAKPEPLIQGRAFNRTAILMARGRTVTAKRPPGQDSAKGRKASIKRATKETDIEVAVDLDGKGASNDRDRHRLLRPHARSAGAPLAHRHHREGQGRPAHRPPPHHRGCRHRARPGGEAGARRHEGHHPLRRRARADGRGADPGRHRHFGPAVPGVQGRSSCATRSAPSTPSWCRNGSRPSPPMPASRCTSQVLYGTNDHHIAESCFKGLARALRAAFASIRARPMKFRRPRAAWADRSGRPRCHEPAPMLRQQSYVSDTPWPSTQCTSRR